MTEQSVWIVYRTGGVVVGVCASSDGAERLAKQSRADGGVAWVDRMDLRP